MSVTPSPGSNITAFDLWDIANPRSVINLVPAKTADLIREAYMKEPDLFGMGERELARLLKDSNRQPSPTDNRLRLNFWLEYENAQLNIKDITLARVAAGICSHAYFTDKYLRHSHKVAWLLTPPASYEIVVAEALQFGMEQMREILDLENTFPNGQINLKLLEIKAKIVGMMDLRLKGLPTQKIEQKSMSYTYHDSAKEVAGAAEAHSMAQLQERIKDLERRERRALNLPEPTAPGPVASEAATIDAEFTKL